MADAQSQAQQQWGEGVEEVTISVPAAWEDDQRNATEQAALQQSLILNAIDLTPFVGPFAVAAFGFTREFSTWSGVIFSPGDFRQTTLEQFLALFQGFGQ